MDSIQFDQLYSMLSSFCEGVIYMDAITNIVITVGALFSFFFIRGGFKRFSKKATIAENTAKKEGVEVASNPVAAIDTYGFLKKKEEGLVRVRNYEVETISGNKVLSERKEFLSDSVFRFLLSISEEEMKSNVKGYLAKLKFLKKMINKEIFLNEEFNDDPEKNIVLIQDKILLVSQCTVKFIQSFSKDEIKRISPLYQEALDFYYSVLTTEYDLNSLKSAYTPDSEEETYAKLISKAKELKEIMETTKNGMNKKKRALLKYNSTKDAIDELDDSLELMAMCDKDFHLSNEKVDSDKLLSGKMNPFNVKNWDALGI